MVHGSCRPTYCSTFSSNYCAAFLSLSLSLFLAHDLCGAAAALLIIAIIVATVYSFQLWQQRLDSPRHAMPRQVMPQ